MTRQLGLGLRHKLMLSTTLVTVVAMATLGIVLMLALEDFFLQQLQDTLLAEAMMLSEQVQDDLQAGQRAIALHSPHTVPGGPMTLQARILVVDAQGRLAAASRLQDMAHIGEPIREEGIERALLGQVDMGRLPQPLLGGDAIYVAIPIMKDGRPVGAVRFSHSIVTIQEEMQRIRLIVLLAIAITTLLMIVMTLRLAASITAPLRALAVASHEVAHGRLSQQVPMTGDDEVDQLAQAFNTMTTQLADADRARRSFLADLAHELKAPVGGLKAGVEALTAGAKANAPLRDRLLDGIANEVHRLERLTNDLILFARLDVGQLEVRHDPLNLAQVIALCCQSGQAMAEQAHISLSCEIPSQLPTIRGDADRLAQVVTNLLDNALKFTPPGGRVSVRAWVEGSAIHVAVSDGGPGFAPEDLPHIFNRFYRGRTQGRERPGIGLGLAIARSIVEAHGGSITAYNRPGGGAEVAITLPLSS